MSRSGRDSSDRTLEFYFALSVSIGILRSAAFSLTIRICFSPSIRLIRRVSSRHASAKYAVARLHDPRATEFRQKVTSADANDRRGKQMMLNVGDRGREPAWLGSDYRASGNTAYTLRYVSQMGGWAVKDFVLHFDRGSDSVSAIGLCFIP